MAGLRQVHFRWICATIRPVKSYTQPELRTFVGAARELLMGSQLQDVVSNDRGIAFGFWNHGKIWLVVDLAAAAPLVLVYRQERAPLVKKSKPKPLALFANAHAVGAEFRELRVLEDFGRVVELTVESAVKKCRVEIVLIPGHPNISIECEGRSIHWEKPQQLAPAKVLDEYPPERDLEAVHRQWLERQASGEKPKADPEEQWRRKRDKDIEKKEKALEKLLQSQENAVDWYTRGDAIKGGEGELIDPKHSRSWNIEEAFRRAKQARQKKSGTEERIEILRSEIQALREAVFRPRAAAPSRAPDLFAKTEARGRKLELDGGLVAYLGRNAKDNLALLRRAKGWDYWLHLRDYPGAHAILSRHRDQVIGDETLAKVAQWLVKETVTSKQAMSLGDVAVAIVECRFVRPIKGDKLGRVTYHNARHMNVKMR